MKKVFWGLPLGVILIVVTLNVNLINSNTGDDMAFLSLSNVEALASENSGSGKTFQCWQTLQYENGELATHETYCGSCEPYLCTKRFDQGQCTKQK